MSSVTEWVTELNTLDVGALDRPGVQAALSCLAAVKGWHDGVHIRLSRRLHELAEASPSIFPEADIAAASKTSRRAATQAARRSHTLDAVPALEDALTSGECSTDHIDALGRAMQRLHATERAQLAAEGARLAELARRTSPEDFDQALKREITRLDPTEPQDRLAKQRRAARFRSWTDRDTGMVCFRGELDPETGLQVVSRVDAAVETLFHAALPEDCPQDEGKHDFLRAQALTRLVLRRGGPTRTTAAAATPTATATTPTTTTTTPTTTASTPTTTASGEDGHDAADDGCPQHNATANGGGAHTSADDGLADIDVVDNRCEMMVVIDLETLLHGLHARSIIDNGHNIDLPLESYRRMACQAAIIPVVLDSNGVCVDEGREIRLANRKQRRALRAMYDTCGIPGCAVRSRHCEPHHIRWWRHWGRTDLNNLLPLCSRHHHAVHEGGWQLVMHPDRSLTITYPDGTVQTTGPPRTQRAAA